VKSFRKNWAITDDEGEKNALLEKIFLVKVAETICALDHERL
jgi:hypothetical protein